jgi:putative aminopeptidase FrvX
LGVFFAWGGSFPSPEAGGAPGDVAAVAAVQEEVGDFGGARVATFALEPAIAIAVDVTHATDVP